MVDFSKYLKVRVDPSLPSDVMHFEQDGKRVGTIVNIAKEDPKPVISLSTEQVNLKHLYNRMMAAQEAYAAAHYEWLQLGQHISNRLKHERQERQDKL